VAVAAPRLRAGSAIRVARQRAGLSARQLSLNAGLGDAYVSRVEAGITDPGLRAFAKLAVALGLSPLEVWLVVVSEAVDDEREPVGA
jgi:transcriptional regulator with XRE-family HTH domain